MKKSRSKPKTKKSTRRPVAAQAQLRSALNANENALKKLAAAQAVVQTRLTKLRARLAAQEARTTIPPAVLAYRALLQRTRILIGKHIPRRATALVVTKGDAAWLEPHGKNAWHFPRTRAGEYLGYHPAGDLGAIAMLEAWRAAGAEFFVLPQPSFWWLEHYAGFRRHLEERYRLVVRADDTAAIWSLTEPPAAGAKNLVTQFAAVVAEFQARCERDPVILNWHVDAALEKHFPHLNIFRPSNTYGPLPYLDRTADLVITASNDAVGLSEARRVASAAVLRLDNARKKLTVEWQPDGPRGDWPGVSIVMPCHNGHAMTDACLRSLLETLPCSLRCEVIVVDDCSTDGTAALLKRWAKRDARVKYLRNKKNLGFVDTCNYGAAQATGEMLVFLNNDLALLPGWLEPLLRVFRDHPDAGVAGGKLIFPDGTLQEAGGVIFRDGSAMNYGRTSTDLDAPQYDFLREVDYCSGALFATPRALFTQLGGFGAEYRPGYCEDADYCFKVRAAGRRVFFQPQSAVVHREGGTAGTDLAKGMKRYQVINQSKLVKRWRDALKLQPERPTRMDAAAQMDLALKSGGKRAVVSWYYPPEFDRDSGSRSVLDLIELLQAEGWSVTFLASHRLNDLRYVRHLQARGVMVVDGSKTPAADFFATLRFDLALLAFWPVAEIYLATIRRVSPATRIIVNSGDLHLLRNSRRVFKAARDQRRVGVLDTVTSGEFARELNIYAAADAVLTVSQKEADLINDLISEPLLTHAVPDTERTELSPVPLKARRGIVFMGSFRHPPNADAVAFLCREVVPHLHPALTARHPIYILGEGLTDDVRQLAAGLPQVRMVGWVASVQPYLERARLSVIPLRFGAGTKRKLLQTIVTGTPAVSTTVGIEGFGLTDGEQVLVADAGKQFADAITRLLTDDALWHNLATQGRDHLLVTHGRAAVQNKLRATLATVFAAPPKTGVEPTASAASVPAAPARLDQQQYRELVGQIRQLAKKTLPPRAQVIVVSKGDDALLQLHGRTGWHFPQDKKGVYAGHHPADSAAVIAQVEALRKKGGEFLLLPGTSLWWLDHYQEFREHLAAHYQECVRDDSTCVIFDLRVKQAAPGLARTEGKSVGKISDVRLIAFYLPQFHPIPENDAWWGQGFTEWTNVGRALPAFAGHYQPQLPADLGFYDLRLAETRAAQAELARAHGLHGFCYYHYWFGGQRLLERPFNEVLASGQPDFPFCLCWANEPWSRRWDGQAENILQAQNYSEADDVDHIRWLLPALRDKRAIQIEGKPVFVVYQGRDLPDPARTIATWRREVAAAGLPGIYLLSVETGWDAGWDATTVGFDAKILFAPQFTTLFNSGAQIPVPGKDKLRVFDYQKAWPVLAQPEPVNYLRYETVCPAWDNSARRGDEATVLHNSTPAAYEQWLRAAVERAQTQPAGQRVVFINAWNEWAEGTHLEPDLKNGLTYLQATRRALNTTLKSAAPRRRVNGKLRS